jgi:hypothetical protein
VYVVLLLLIAAAFGATLRNELAAPPPASGDDVVAPPAAAAPPTTAPRLKPLASYAETVARPLFSPIRRAPAPAASAVALGQVTGLALSGIVISKNERHALIQHGHSGIARRVAEGEEIDGWTVRSIRRDGIVLQHGATEHELLLRDNEAQGH